MEQIEIISRSLRSVAWMFALQGVLAISFGLLIILYPPLLALLVGVTLMILGLTLILAAVMVGKFSRVRIAS